MKKRIWKRLCALALCAALGVGLCPAALAEEPPEEEAPSAEVLVSPWARSDVGRAYELGLLSADFDLGEDYSAPIKRIQFARLAVELIAFCRETDVAALLKEQDVPLAESEVKGGPSPQVMETAQSRFNDTSDAYVELAARLGIVKGVGSGTFAPDKQLTRTEAAVMLQRCMTVLGRPDASAAPKTFSDAYTIPRWAVEPVKYISGRTTAEGTAIMGGAGGQFRPLESYSIEQAIITVLRCYDSVGVEAVYDGWREAPGYDTVSVTLSFGGDCTFGRSRGAAYGGSFDEMYDKMGPSYFFSNVKEFQSDDLTMVNFEGALTAYDVPREDKDFIFKGRAEYAKILEAGSVDVVTIANNHARDYGNRGLADTINNLSPYVAVSGYDRRPILTVKGVKVGFASNTGWSFDAAQKKFITDSIADLRARGAEVIVFNYHWGVEREYHSNATQRAIAHYCIDSGADLVIGHHPHVVQEVETYQGKQIVYSLGNLSFGGNRNPTDKNCLIFQQTFTLDIDTREICVASYKAVPYKVSSVSNRNDYRPTPT